MYGNPKECNLKKTASTMGDKSVETLSNNIEFLTILVTFSPFPPKQCWFFYFFDCTYQSAYTTLNWGAGGIRELKLEANKIEQMLKYRKASFPKSVSTTFVAHCRFGGFLRMFTIHSIKEGGQHNGWKGHMFGRGIYLSKALANTSIFFLCIRANKLWSNFRYKRQFLTCFEQPIEKLRATFI